MTDFTFRYPPNFNEGDHPISGKGPTLFQVVPNGSTRAKRRTMLPWLARGGSGDGQRKDQRSYASTNQEDGRAGVLEGIGILKVIFGQSEKYQRDSRMSIRPVSVLNMREAGCEKSFLPDTSKQLRPCGRFAQCSGRRGVLAHRWHGMETDSMGSGVRSGRLKERVGLCRRTGWGSLGQAQMSEDLGDHRWIYDACPEPAEGAAIIDKGPPHFGQAVMSISNTRLRSSAQLRRRCAEEGGSSV